MSHVPPRRSIRARWIALCLVLAVSIAPLAGCNENAFRKAANNADRIATLISSMIDIKQSLATSGTITDAENEALTRALLKANTATKAFNERARQIMAQAQPDTPANRTEIKTLFNEVMSALVDVTNSGVSPIKNPDAKNKLLKTLTTIQSSVLAILTVTDSF